MLRFGISAAGEMPSLPELVCCDGSVVMTWNHELREAGGDFSPRRLHRYNAAIPLKPTFFGRPSISPKAGSDPSLLTWKTLTLPTIELSA